MSMHLKLLALASAAMLALPVVALADANLDLVQNRPDGGTSDGAAFGAGSIDGVAVGTAVSIAQEPFSPISSAAFSGARVASANTTPDRASGYGFVPVSATDPTEVVGLDDAVEFDGAATPFSGTMYVGEALAGYTGPRAVGTVVSAVGRGESRSLADGGIGTSAPEPVPFVLLGVGLLGLGVAFRRRRLHHAAPFDADS
jgi:hypothetical protein